MLTQQLRELERDGIVSRKVFPVAPPKGEYAFTPYGRTLEPLLEAMKTWSENHRLQESDLIPC